ncbi:HD domain-containing protein [Candidatus Bathyarchaeota archaeon]|nr:HD domain-containing protein [Candidatus Bathyarchaeota archaeon]
MKAKYEKLRRIVQKELSCSAHAMEHIERVFTLCLHLAEYESNVDLDVLKTAALLHDLARVKEFRDKTGTIDHATLGAEMAARILKDLRHSDEKISRVKHCITTHRFRGNSKPQTIEAKILFDADKLDVLGAVGVARSFMMAGQYGQKIYSDISLKNYLANNVLGQKTDGRIIDISKHAPNLEFQLKFSRILSSMYTERAKEMAKERFRFMNSFFRRLEAELSVKA